MPGHTAGTPGRNAKAYAMELYHLRTFITVAETGSVTQAARRLFMTPPSVTAHIKSLEDELQVQLFRRTAQGWELVSSTTSVMTFKRKAK